MKTMSYAITTETLTALAESDTRNFFPEVDPDGIHICQFNLLHGDDTEVRSVWLVKLTDSDIPTNLSLITPLDTWNQLRAQFSKTP